MSTSINDLPQNNNSTSEDINENMMVNNILKEIENDEDLNNENEDSLKYMMDNSQVPPKINNQIPTQDMIKEATNDIFKETNEDKTLENFINEVEPIKEINKENIVSIEEQLSSLESPNVKTRDLVPNVDGMFNNIINKAKGPVIIFILFMIISLPQINKLLLKILPKLFNEMGHINMLGNIIKGLVISIIYFISSFFI